MRCRTQRAARAPMLALSGLTEVSDIWRIAATKCRRSR
jgi:hypothetical protein